MASSKPPHPGPASLKSSALCAAGTQASRRGAAPPRRSARVRSASGRKIAADEAGFAAKSLAAATLTPKSCAVVTLSPGFRGGIHVACHARRARRRQLQLPARAGERPLRPDRICGKLDACRCHDRGSCADVTVSLRGDHLGAVKATRDARRGFSCRCLWLPGERPLRRLLRERETASGRCLPESTIA